MQTIPMNQNQRPADRLYLQVESNPGDHFVSDQDADPRSLFNTVRQLTHLRRAHLALCNCSDYQMV
jgi:hypothetical protein